ncbi:acetate--CoA ligase family protein, partial [Streptomyces sp. NPDC000941]
VTSLTPSVGSVSPAVLAAPPTVLVTLSVVQIPGLAEALAEPWDTPGAGAGDEDGEAPFPAPRIPAYPAAERAVRALAEAEGYARWRRQAVEPGRVPEYEDIDEAGAAADIDVLLAPTDAAPTEGVATEGVATEGALAAGALVGAALAEEAPAEGAPTDAMPTEAAAAEGAPAEGALLDTASAEEALAEAAPPGEPPPYALPAHGSPADKPLPQAAPADGAPRPQAAAAPPEASADAHAPYTVTLSAPDAQRLLARYGVSVLPAFPAPDADAAVRAAARLGFPVALKTTAPHLRHRADLGGVRLDIGGEAELRRAYAELTDYLGAPEELRLVVQRMAPRGVDTVVRAAIDPAAGAVLSFGLAGAPSELLGDTAHRLVPATDRDAAELIRSIRTAPLLFGWRGSRPVDTAALEELLLRVSRMVDDHPEVVSVDLEPVVVAPHGLSVLGAAVRLAPPPPRTDLGPRHLPSY